MTLFAPLKLRELELKNRIGVSPMCEYSAKDGHPGPWHMVHLGSRAVGGAGIVITEATAVQAIGRISPADTGIYLDAHIESWKPIAEFIRGQGAVPGMQLAHAGRKASTAVPWKGGSKVAVDDGGWVPVAPSAVAFDANYAEPRALTIPEMDQIVEDFRAAARRALAAGFQVVEMHAAHGYLAHEFLSPLSNLRTDEYGGSLENRMRFPLRVAQAVRETWPAKWPVFVRISATDWKEGGWDLAQSIELCKRFRAIGVDLIDVSSGGLVPGVQIPLGPGYQVKFAEAIRRDAGIAMGAVGMLTDPAQVETILSTGQADMVFLARELLRDPYWPRRAAQELGAKITPPVQYLRAW
ncbi:MAG TPA: NADH:flavin oxidoreductase/NADH oxidase [Candidatus Eisenbacteria bacterium]|nr:NADH:flavin oxidoreductase/NADH oxidase [Candidatus Eisenbacteria bacterium]